MVQINFALKEVNCKIVYYGPGMSGKTTNLEVVHEKAPESNKGELTSIATEGDRTLFFDFMPLDLGNIAGMRTKFQLYTVPGQVYYNSTRKLVLQGVDGIIFVADSQRCKMDENIESLENLRSNLAEYGKRLDDLPIVIQYNKRDLPDVETTEELNRRLNPGGAPWFDGIATTGEGVFPTLKALSAMVLESLARDRSSSGPSAPRKPAPAPLPAPAAEAPEQVAVAWAAATRPEPKVRSITDESFGAVEPARRAQSMAEQAAPPPVGARPAARQAPPANRMPRGPARQTRAQQPVYPREEPKIERFSSRSPDGQGAQNPRENRTWGGPNQERGGPKARTQEVRMPRFVIEEERGSPFVFMLLIVITLVALGVILYSFKVI